MVGSSYDDDLGSHSGSTSVCYYHYDYHRLHRTREGSWNFLAKKRGLNSRSW